LKKRSSSIAQKQENLQKYDLGTRQGNLPDNHEKRQLGELWEKRSKGKCLFIMPKGKDFEAIRERVKQ
jgi:hypothetical protein